MGPRPFDLVELIEDVADPVAEEPKPQFRVGQVWRARDGSSHTIAAISPQNVAYPVSSNNYSWTSDGGFAIGDRNPFDLVELIEDAPEPKRTSFYVVASLERFVLAETLSDYDDPGHARPYLVVLERLNGTAPTSNSPEYVEWEATGRAKLKVLRAKALLAVLEAEGGEA
jgi:hypothetical protein